MSDACCGGVCETVPSLSPPVTPWWRRPLMLVVATGALIGAGALADGMGRHPLAVLLFVAAIAGAASGPVRGAVRSIRRRALDINVLMVIAVAGAAALGDWLEAAAVVWLFGVAQWLEARSLDRARLAIRKLLTLTPPTAIVRREGVEREVTVDAVVPGDVLIRQTRRAGARRRSGDRWVVGDRSEPGDG